MNNKYNNTKSFTLIELIITIAIIAALIGIIIGIVKPQEILKKLRDTRRITDLNTIENFISLMLLEKSRNFNPLSYASSNVVYIYHFQIQALHAHHI